MSDAFAEKIIFSGIGRIIMAKKKNKKNIAKRKAKAGQRKAQKRKLRLVKAKQNRPRPQSGHDYMPPDFDYPHLAPDTVPVGFREVGMSEALMEFVKAMTRHPDIRGLESMDNAIGLGMPLWNYSIAVELDDANPAMKSECCKAVMQACNVNLQEAEDIVEKLVILKHEMFPPDIQPRGGPMMFMRKATRHVIEPFDYGMLVLNKKKLPLTEEDARFLALLTDLDEAKLVSVDDYEQWERKYDPMEEQCGKAFKNWLKGKGIDLKFLDDFSFLATFFVNFVYQYDHDEAGILRNTDELFFEDFFYDFVLRKIIMEPEGHVDWLPALRLFFLFLDEIGYLADARPYVDTLNTFEEPFLQLLRREFG